jgi:protein-disulfide isomerase
MKTPVLVFIALLAAGTLSAHTAPPDAKPLDAATEKLARQALPVCAGMTLASSDFPYKLPQGLSGRIIHVSSPSHACDGQHALITSATNTWYLGNPWFIGDSEGTTFEQKLQNFTWANLKANVTVTVDRKRSAEGLFPATLWQVTERGKVPLDGLVDADGRVFFLGRFQSQASDAAKGRMVSLQPLLESAPTRGAASPAVTIVEFSDFQCPSCKRTSGLADSILSRHGDQVRYIRFDLPLISNHPWAFSAALAGRAIYRQKPDLFWEYKKAVYENQESLNAFVFDDFARGFAQDHELDLAKYDADMTSEALRDELLKGVGAAFSYQVRGTPTFMVNGSFIEVGADGKELDAYVAELLKK